MMAVAEQARLAASDGEHEAAEAHLQAVRSLLAQSAGLAACRDVPWRILVWTDLRAAAYKLRKPILPLDDTRNPENLPAWVNEQATSMTLTTLATIPENSPYDTTFAFNLLHIIHQRTLASTLTHLDINSVQYLSYRSCYMLCEALSDINDADHAPEISTFDALVVACQMFIWSTLKFFSPTNMINVSTSRILYRGLLLQDDLLCHWRQGAGLPALLWTLFTGCSCLLTMDATMELWMPQPPRTWFIDRLKEIVDALQIVSMNHLLLTLKLFPWNDDCRKRVESLADVLCLRDQQDAEAPREKIYDWDTRCQMSWSPRTMTTKAERRWPEGF